ncbi:pyridoxal-phosphate dependent enzyme [Nonomuraea sp. CA-218870]|uniref:pyridoxal-phosphate dependent enzyme n=1 Tax=Nonomuraea sp. CA-218870 TaxID=3239998 RepID=UPI003D8DEEF6
MLTSFWYANPAARRWSCPPPSDRAREFHASLPGYSPTPLTELPTLAGELGVRRVLVKDESARLGLPAFKALGASWAIHRILERHEGPLTLVTATDGNHGRAVARMARLLGQRARVFTPGGVHPEAVAAIAAEGADVTEVGGSYDEAVKRAASAAEEPGAVLVQDTAWEGYEETPGWIVEGYGTLFAELDEQLGEAPGLVVVPAGVGSLAQAAVAHYRARSGTAVMIVEPEAAACVLAGLLEGRPARIGTGDTIMAGLNCGTPSSLAWPYLRDGLDAAVAVGDADSARAARELLALGVDAGPCGAASLAGARAALTSAARRPSLGVPSDSAVVLLNTEGTAANPALRPGG